MRRKQIAAILVAAAMTVGGSMTSLAASWQWLDGDGDGVAECYYFDDNGNMLANTTTPDGYIVDSNGAWVVNGVVQTQGTSTQNTSGVNHNAGYDPAHPLKNKVVEWDLKITPTKYTDYIVDNNIHAMLTGQMDQYFAPPVGEFVDSMVNHIYTSQEDYDEARNNEQAIYNWFCNWLNGMNFENMSEMERAKEIQKVLSECSYNYDTSTYSTYDPVYSVLINKTGICGDFAVTAYSLAKSLGLKSAMFGTGNHAVYYIQVDNVAYMGSNQVLNLDYPTTDNVYFMSNQK